MARAARQPGSEAAWTERARASLANGDLIAAYDAAARGIAENEPAPPLHFLQVLALARMGDTARAIERYEAYGLAAATDDDAGAVRARLLKDEALTADTPEREALLDRASAAYRAIHARTGGYYPGVNAATLALLAGRREDARALACTLLDDPALRAPADYYAAATRAEALLLCGDVAGAEAAIRIAVGLADADLGARSSTRRQLDLLGEALNLAEAERRALLAPLRPPATAMFCGHIFAADFTAEAVLAGRIAAVLDAHAIGFFYGALACGADILIAEAVLARASDLIVVLPFGVDDFICQSVAIGGEPWIPRFHACLARATAVVHASTMEFVGDPHQFAHGSRIAMGLAKLRARHLGGDAVQLAVWNGVSGGAEAGTSADVAAWRASGGETIVVNPGTIARTRRGAAPEPAGPAPKRALRAMIFADFPGFSFLPEAVLPAFWEEVMGRIAAVLDRYPDEIAFRNTWGDALFAVVTTPAAAAGVALDLAASLAEIDHARLGVPPGTSMRVGAHYGSIYHARDPVAGRMAYYGTEVSLAARIEPVTPPGSVYVTAPLAAMLALEADGRFRTGYVGRVALAKGYGSFPMYRLTRDR